MNTTERIQQAIVHVKEHHPKGASLYEKALLGKCGKAQALKAKCMDCSNYDRESVDLCTVVVCPLWHFRPRFGENKALQKKRNYVMTEEHRRKVSENAKKQCSKAGRQKAIPCQESNTVQMKNEIGKPGKGRTPDPLDW